MFTSRGKQILAKYLVGQTPAYASYIAIGCGAKPLLSDGVFSDYSSYNSLDFEMFRVPISSRGYVVEDGVPKIVLTAQLPTEERYEISEIGVYSAGSNPNAGPRDSRLIYGFTQNENWEYHTSTSSNEIQSIYQPLDSANDGVIDQGGPVFQTNADNRIFTNVTRANRYERCRFFNNIVVIQGSTCSIDDSGETLSVTSGDHIHYNGASIRLDQNAPTDELRLAFSVINKSSSSTAQPGSVKILIDFSSQDELGSGEFARFEVNIDNGTDEGQHDFSSNRYLVVSKQLQELYKSAGFSWTSVNVVKVYASVEVSGVPSDDFYVCLDALRLENMVDTANNPLYGLTGYSVVKSKNAETIIKRSNTTNFVEFRFAVGIEV